METIIEKLLEWVLGKSQKDGAIFYFKSLLFLILIVCFISNKMWNMNESIKNLLNAKAIAYITESVQIGIHFFTCLAIISFILTFFAAMLRLFPGKFFERYNDYFNRVRIGAENRLCNSVEDVLLLLMIAYIFDENILQSYVAIYSNVAFRILGILCAIYVFFTSSVRGMINRFFMLKPYAEENEKTLI